MDTRSLRREVQRIFCRAGLHAWKKPRRVKGFLVHLCSACPARQEQTFPGGGWKTVPPKKWVRKPKLLPVAEEQRRDAEQGLEPL